MPNPKFYQGGPTLITARTAVTLSGSDYENENGFVVEASAGSSAQTLVVVDLSDEETTFDIPANGSVIASVAGIPMVCKTIKSSRTAASIAVGTF